MTEPEATPSYEPREPRPGKVVSGKELNAGVWNARMLLREQRERGYSGYRILIDRLFKINQR